MVPRRPCRQICGSDAGVETLFKKPSPKRETSAYLRQVLSLFKLMPHVDGLVYTTLYTRSLRAVLG